MKNYFLISILLFTIAAKAQKVTINEINLKSLKLEGDFKLLGKSKEDYLFGTSTGTGAIFFGPPKQSPLKLLLLNKNFQTIQSTNLTTQLEDAPIENLAYEDVVFFNDQIYVILEQELKKEKTKKFYLYTLDNKTLKINFGSGILLGDVKTLFYMKRNVVDSRVLHSVSEDGSKLGITLLSKGSFYAFEESNTMRASNMVFDKNLKTVCVSSFMDDEFKDDSKASNSTSIESQQVMNDGNLYLLANYHKDRIKNYYGNFELYNYRLYFVGKDCKSKIIDIKLPEEANVSSALLNANNNNAIVTGFPSIFKKQNNEIFGYLKQTMHNQGNVLSLNVMPFDKFFIDNVKDGNGIFKNNDIIQYDNTVLTDDGSFFMISQISRKDIIVSYMNKNGKVIWVKNIDRRFVSSAKVEAMFNETSKELFLVYEDNIDGTGMYATKINIDGTMSESTEIIPDIRLFPSNKCKLKNEIVMTDLAKNKLIIAVIKF